MTRYRTRTLSIFDVIGLLAVVTYLVVYVTNREAIEEVIRWAITPVFTSVIPWVAQQLAGVFTP